MDVAIKPYSLSISPVLRSINRLVRIACPIHNLYLLGTKPQHEIVFCFGEPKREYSAGHVCIALCFGNKRKERIGRKDFLAHVAGEPIGERDDLFVRGSLA